jgi:hypothetical protein
MKGKWQVMDVSAGKAVANISVLAGVDQVAYDPKAKLYFDSTYKSQVGEKKDGAPRLQLAVTDATSNVLMQTWATESELAHSVAVGSETNQVVVPLAKSSITVYSLSSSSSSSSISSSTAPMHTTNTAGRWASSVPLVVGGPVLVVPFVG